MNENDERNADGRPSLRRGVYLLLVCIGAGAMLGRILAVDSVDMVGVEAAKLKKVESNLKLKRHALAAQGLSGEALEQELARWERRWRDNAVVRRPFLSANDRSRWCTVRALVEEDMCVPDAPYAIDLVVQQRNWDTIDMVKHGGHLYSSKPTLLPTLMAGVYWPIHRLTGATLGTHPHEIGRFMLVLFNVVPLVVGWLLLARLVERFGVTDWGRIFVMAAAVFGTFLTTFAVTINNHLPAAVCAIAAVYAAVPIWFDGRRRLRDFFVVGFFGALAVFNEFPAAALLAVLAAALLWRSPRWLIVGFAPAVALVAAASFGTNWIAHHTLKPAYAHRTTGDDWYNYTYERNGRTIKSYWIDPVGVDRGEPSAGRYAVNVLVGDHGIFSLTPIWLLSFAGMGAWMFRRGNGNFCLRWMAAGIAAVTLACLVFYLIQPEPNRNYGGVACGLRWMFWLAPLWLLTMTPMADIMSARRWTHGLALALLALSVLSVSYPTWNPWTQPWIMNFVQYVGWGV